jgi:hypothetical protein
MMCLYNRKSVDEAPLEEEEKGCYIPMRTAAAMMMRNDDILTRGGKNLEDGLQSLSPLLHGVSQEKAGREWVVGCGTSTGCPQ